MSQHHVIAWVDHEQARIFSLSGEDVEASRIHLAHPHHHIHHKANSIGSGKNPLDPSFLSEIIGAFRDAKEVLIVGPGNAKQDLVRYIHEHAHDVEKKIVGVETVDHPTDGQIIAYAKRHFHATSKMRGENFA